MTVISVVGQIGALIGGTSLGYVSTFTGRRLIMIIAAICGGALVPAYIFPRNMSLVASAFFYQFFVGGVWGPIPIYLQELAPPALRTTAVGLTYQLGNLASSASATIQAKIGEQFPISPGPKGVKRFNYGKVIAIFCGAVWAYQRKGPLETHIPSLFQRLPAMSRVATAPETYAFWSAHIRTPNIVELLMFLSALPKRCMSLADLGV